MPCSGIGLAGLEHIPHFVQKVIQIAELLINAGKTNISDLVYDFQPLGNRLADLDRLHLTIVFAKNLFFDLLSQPLERFGADGAFEASFL